MNTTELILGGFVLLALASRSNQTPQQQTVNTYLNDPTNWGADMWARIYGADLAAAGGQHNAQSGLTVYGVTTNSMGFMP